MSQMMQIAILGEPPTVTAQEKRIRVVQRYVHGKKVNVPIMYDSERIKKAKQFIMDGLEDYIPLEPINEGIHLDVIWAFEKGKSHRNAEYRLTKPDTDNLEKMLKDCITASGIWTDDKLVAYETVRKIWSDTPGIFINIRTLPKYYYEDED